jgi:thiol-disulfide isomerase/thioredoxin
MTLRRALPLAMIIGLLVGSFGASAAETNAYTPKAFGEAQKAGKSILVDITAPWCPVCRAQKPILADLAADPKFKDLVVFEVDFDNQKDAVRAFKAQTQSTLVVFKGEKEVGRSVGDTHRKSIAALVASAL